MRHEAVSDRGGSVSVRVCADRVFRFGCDGTVWKEVEIIGAFHFTAHLLLRLSPPERGRRVAAVLLPGGGRERGAHAPARAARPVRGAVAAPPPAAIGLMNMISN